MNDLLAADNSEKPSLLIVDDDTVFCEVLTKAMKKRGFDVTCAHTIEDALNWAEQSTPEYAIVDLKLSSESGLVLVEELRATGSGYPHCDAHGLCQHRHGG